MSAKKTTEQVIEEFRKVHGDKYDYSNVEYKNALTKVTIICPEHGEFQQSPNKHKNGQRCPFCANEMGGEHNRLSSEVVIEDFRKAHGDRYDYSKVDYKNNNTKVSIICPEHGEFRQVPASHKQGMGCPICGYGKLAIARSLSKDIVIEGFKKVHGERYDYSKVEYAAAKSKVTIICPEHGEFFQTPNNHKSGQGCPHCGGSIMRTSQQVIEEFRKAHGDRYDYSKVDYNNMGTKVTIICPEHGEFQQSPNNHKSGQGCPTCGGSLSKTTPEVIEEFKKVHGDKYDYSKVDYKNTGTKVTIICPEHGEFQQSPNKHKSGQSCPACGGKGLSGDKWIELFIKTHGDKYDYSKVEYKKSNAKVSVICPEHGEFFQTPVKHKSGNGCPSCFGSFLKTTVQIIEEFRKVHSDKYDYSKVDYNNNHTKVIIICPDHGEFKQSPAKHNNGQGCPECANERIGEFKSISQEEVIDNFIRAHGNKYDYSKVDYKKSNIIVTIILH